MNSQELIEDFRMFHRENACLKYIPVEEHKKIHSHKSIVRYFLGIKASIVSIYQPHLRPIVRGKAKAKVEFGAKIGASIVNGYTYVDHLSWDAYNESSDLAMQL